MKKITISPDNHKAIAFFNKLSEKDRLLKAKIQAKLDLEVSKYLTTLAKK